MMKKRHPLLLPLLLCGFVILGVFLPLQLITSKGLLEQPTEVSKDDTYYDYRIIHLKFRESSSIRLSNHAFISLAGENLVSLNTLLDYAHVAELRPTFSNPEAIATSAANLEELHSFYLIVLKPSTSIDFSKEMITQLNQQPAVEMAYPDAVGHAQ